MRIMNNLEFRRQFLFTPKACEDLQGWEVEKLQQHFLYIHPDCPHGKAIGKSEVYLIGYFVDPHSLSKSVIQETLDQISEETSPTNISKIIYPLVGRFVLIIKTHDNLLFFNDACGLKTIYYTKRDNVIYAASQPLLLKKVIDINKCSYHDEYFNSKYVRNHLEHWLPSGLSLYEDVHQLVPNHYFTSAKNKQQRYWPSSTLKKQDYESSLIKFKTLLKKIITTAHDNMEMAFSFTAGWDSRILLSCCKDIKDELMFYTLKYRNITDKHPDLSITSKLAGSLGLSHHVFDCRRELDEDFIAIYRANTHISHIEDWGRIAYGMLNNYPEKRIALKGNCSEVGRCYYYPTGKHSKNLKALDFIRLEKFWDELHFVRERVEEWFEEIKAEQNNRGYDLYDLFYWEHRMGSWQAQSQLEWDIVQEVFTPFNSRELLDIMLAMDTSYRKANDYQLYQDTMKILWEEVLAEPINPLSMKKRTKKIVKNLYLRSRHFLNLQ